MQVNAPRAEYFVRNEALRLLKLEGPFAYPKWVDHPGAATLLSFARAHAFRAACGGHVVPVPAMLQKSIEPAAFTDGERTALEELLGSLGDA